MGGGSAGEGGTVLFVVPRFHTNLWFATAALVAAGYRVEVFAETSQRAEDHRHVRPQVFPPGTPAATITAALAAAAPDLVIVRNAGSLSQAVETALRRRRHPRVVSYDQRPLTRRRSLLQILRLRLSGRPYRRVTPVPGLETGAPADRHAGFLPWPVARIGAGILQPAPAGTPLRLLCVAKLRQGRKRCGLLLDAVRPALAEGRVSLTFVGSSSAQISGPDEAALPRLLAAEAAFPGRVTVRADLPFAEMPGLYAQHDLCILPSLAEPLGTAPLEAMAYGCVPVITATAGSAGYLRPGETGFRLDPAAGPAELAALIDGVATDRAGLARMSAAARAYAETELSPAVFVARIAALMPPR